MSQIHLHNSSTKEVTCVLSEWLLSHSTDPNHDEVLWEVSHASHQVQSPKHAGPIPVCIPSKPFHGRCNIHHSPPSPYSHWLPTKHRIDFKILLITYKALNGLAPQYLSELLSHYSPSRPLRSQNSGHLIIPRISKSTAGGRSFSYLAPKLWNNLPNTVREADTLCQFKSRLKTHLFNLAYT